MSNRDAVAFKTHSFRIPFRLYPPTNECGQPYHAPEPASRREEARRNRARQLAERLADGPLEVRDLIAGSGGRALNSAEPSCPGWTRAALLSLASESGDWIRLDGPLWALLIGLTDQGRIDLLMEEIEHGNT